MQVSASERTEPTMSVAAMDEVEQIDRTVVNQSGNDQPLRYPAVWHALSSASIRLPISRSSACCSGP
jgi:hypothetical protein